MTKKVMKLALEALNNATSWRLLTGADWVFEQVDAAIKALEKALETKDEPVVEFKSPSQRWEDGDDHDPRSEALYKFIADTDFKHCGDSFCFKSGGDGDNGETLMFILDCWFASTPQQRTWVELTDGELPVITAFDGHHRTLVSLAETKEAYRYISETLRKKNGFLNE